MEKLPFVSLVVVNYNGEKIIKPCLDSIQKINYPSYETIVVDNCSTDKSLDIIKKYKNVKLIKNKKNLGYVGINTSLKTIKGKYIFIMNNDLELDRNCVLNLVKHMESDSTIGVGAPKFINYHDRRLKSGGTWISRSFYSGHFEGSKKENSKEIPYLGIEMVRKSVVDKFGYIYDPDYFIYAEDLDLSLRFRLLGYKTMFVPSAIVYHMHSVTMQKGPQKFSTFLMERNLLETFLKTFKIGTTLLLLPYIALIRAMILARDLLTLNFSLFFARLRAYGNIIIDLPRVIRKRRKLQKMRNVDDSYMLAIFSEKYLFRRKFLV